MRSRYLATDVFFAWSSGSTEKQFETQNVPFLQVPDLRGSDRCLSSPNPSAFEIVSYLPMPFELDPLPIHGALSSFYDEVIPKEIDCWTSQFEARKIAPVSEKLEEFICKDYMDMEGNASPGDFCKVKETHSFFKFEMPVLENSLKDNVDCFKIVGEGIVLDQTTLQTTFANETGSEIPYPNELGKFIYNVEDISLKCSIDNGRFYFDDSDNLLDEYSNFLLFELNEIGLDHDMNLSNVKALDFLLRQIECVDMTQTYQFGLDSNEVILSMNINDLENFPKPVPVDDCVQFDFSSFISILDLDLIILKDTALVEKKSAIYPMVFNNNSIQKPCLVQYQEVHVLDFPAFKAFEIFQTLCEDQELSDQIFSEYTLPIGDLYGSIISSELTLVDETLISLPTPVIYHAQEKISSNTFLKTILDDLNPNPMCAYDDIYLDWHLLLGNICGRESCYAYIDTLVEVTACVLPPQMHYARPEKASIDLSFWDDVQIGPKEIQCKEAPLQLSVAYSKWASQINNVKPDSIHEDDIQETRSSHIVTEMNSRKVSSLFESMSQSSDLNFFLNVRHGKANMEKVNDITQSSIIKDAVPNSSSEMTFRQWDIKAQHISLSDCIVHLIDDIYKCFLGTSQHHSRVKYGGGPFLARHDFKLLELSKDKLMEIFTEKFLNQPISALIHDDRIEFVALYAVRRLVYFLCFFGIHPAYMYMLNISQSADYLTVMLRPIISLLENTQWKVEKELIESHPSLSVIEDILRSNSCCDGKKTLIVASRIFWLTLRQKLYSMKIQFHEVPLNEVPLDHHNMGCSELANSVSEALLQSNCLLLSYEQIFASFPLSKFDIVVEYGGSYISSRMLTICSKMAISPQIYFLNIKLEDYSIPKELCEGFDIFKENDFKMGSFQSVSTKKDKANFHTIMELLNFIPTLEDKTYYPTSSESENKLFACNDVEPSLCIPNSATENILDTSITSFHKSLVIFNTKNAGKEMLMTRRSSYQKVLAMEKGGLQVVERDIDISVDIILSADISLVWYNSKNIRSCTHPIEPNSGISTTMDIIATNIMMMLSFSFKSCLMIFEGESNFLATVMDSSDALYAAASSLDMHLQLFCTYSSESTDEIIQSCINHTTKLHGDVYPAMTELETLAESFLVNFSSINPLSAHGILSSSATLFEFLEWSNDCRTQAVGKYHIPYESISLFSTLCRYGEITESKSGMTDCSSADSDINTSKLQFQNKRQKSTMAIKSNQFQMFLPVRQPDIVSIDHSKSMQPSWLIDDPTHAKASIQSNIASTDHSRALQPSWSRDSYDILEDVEEDTRKNNFCVDNELFGRNVLENSSTDSLGFDDQIRYFNKFNAGEDFSNNVPVNHKYSTLGDFKRKETVPCNRIRSGCSNVDEFFSLMDQNKSLDERNGSLFPSLNLKAISSMERIMQEGALNGFQISEGNKNTNNFGENLFSKALQSRRFCEYSPWRSEFYNTVNEKGKMPTMQSLAYNSNLEPRSADSSKRKEKILKIRSPSSIDKFRYQGSSSSQSKLPLRIKNQKIIPGGRHRVNLLKNDKKVDTSSIIPAWTPVDKRARQNLSFVQKGNEKQSNLIWRNTSNANMDRRFRKRNWEEM